MNGDGNNAQYIKIIIIDSAEPSNARLIRWYCMRASELWLCIKYRVQIIFYAPYCSQRPHSFRIKGNWILEPTYAGTGSSALEWDSQTLPMTTRSALHKHMASVTDNASSGTVERRRKSQEEEGKKITRRRLPNTDIIFELFSILYILLTDCCSGHSNDIPVISLCFFKSPLLVDLFARRHFQHSSFSQSVSFVKKWHFFIMSRIRRSSICFFDVLLRREKLRRQKPLLCLHKSKSASIAGLSKQNAVTLN